MVASTVSAVYAGGSSFSPSSSGSQLSTTSSMVALHILGLAFGFSATFPFPELLASFPVLLGQSRDICPRCLHWKQHPSVMSFLYSSGGIRGLVHMTVKGTWVTLLIPARKCRDASKRAVIKPPRITPVEWPYYLIEIVTCFVNDLLCPSTVT